jgi:hypothetical protein
MDATMPSLRRLGGLTLAALLALAPTARAQQNSPGRVEAIPLATITLSGEAFLTGQKAASRPGLIAGELRLPFPLPPGRKVPAVVLVHGSGGIGASTDL